jgi:6-pyruvoyl-tetrahydropterin synthase
MTAIAVRHNIEVAHRISLPGKCENIHGHSMLVEAKIDGLPMVNSIVGGIDFGKLKTRLRDYLDTNFDHHLLLWDADSLLIRERSLAEYKKIYPGLTITSWDPTVECICRHICRWTASQIGDLVVPNLRGIPFIMHCTVHETGTNSAEHYEPFIAGDTIDAPL